MMQAQKDTGVFILTTPYVDGYQIEEYFGLVNGISIQGVHFLKDFTAYLSDKFGGRVRGYEASLTDAMNECLYDMAKKARKLGANAIIAVDMDTGDVNSKMLMATCYGTAVKIRPKSSNPNSES